MKRIVEINDTLEERIESAIDDIKTLLEEHLQETRETLGESEAYDVWEILDYSGGIHQILDSSVPIYAGEIKDLWYLHGDEFEEAYNDAGVGGNPLENSGMSAIYFYLEQQVRERFEDLWEKTREEKVEELFQATRDNSLRFLISNGFGIYVPQMFAETYGSSWGISEENLKTLKAGPEEEHYWEAWSDVLDGAELIENGMTWRLIQLDGDLFCYWVEPIESFDELTGENFWEKGGF